MFIMRRPPLRVITCSIPVQLYGYVLQSGPGRLGPNPALKCQPSWFQALGQTHHINTPLAYGFLLPSPAIRGNLYLPIWSIFTTYCACLILWGAKQYIDKLEQRNTLLVVERLVLSIIYQLTFPSLSLSGGLNKGRARFIGEPWKKMRCQRGGPARVEEKT